MNTYVDLGRDHCWNAAAVGCWLGAVCWCSGVRDWVLEPVENVRNPQGGGEGECGEEG